MPAVEQSVRLQRISQERYIQAPLEAVYDYVTQPDRWHEWHPTSLGADTGTSGSLPAGARFTEMIDLLGIRVPMSYRVQIARRPDEFKTVFTSLAVDGSIHYFLQAHRDGTLFQRVLTYETELQLASLHERMIQLSTVALDRLKHRLEHSPSASI
ncbi:polyketide cyclase [Pseudomonas fluorescens]|uniref:SRPBCC family protein n=1 Tax=Pseudomonas lactucae TaxID=2813360 RepID=A0A9X1C5Q7_9PSED|nr:SRPBCC family protein [Pseudomonas lactucae]OPA90227.1 polyketide cyclase [Pseudomonas fluorescens]MBN2977331.1 SRPBCC family protein [Pseudomonas lactucae]MBN2989238.1 SRPBCC family protein [Pseudomonas lactucae]OPB09496.1 polyketide cyclase [Pseudomonas fluorescens]OPB21341.1 polyketide cyclase [Pseudomonas fluorescens]